MKQELAQIALVVNDYDEAIEFYTEKLHFSLIEDTVLSSSKRWVIVAPPGATGCRILLAKAATGEQRARVGDQTGGLGDLPYDRKRKLSRDPAWRITHRSQLRCCPRP